MKRDLFLYHIGSRPKFGRMAISSFGQYCLGAVGQKWPNGHLPSCLFVRCRVSVLMSSVNDLRSCRAEMAEWPSSLVFIC